MKTTTTYSTSKKSITGFFNHIKINTGLLSLLLVLLYTGVGFAQTTIYSEDFSSNAGKGNSQGTVNVSGVTNWSISTIGVTINTGEYFYVNGFRFESRGSFGQSKLTGVPAYWYANQGSAIDISSYKDVTVSIDLGSASAYADGQLFQISGNGTDWIDVGYHTATNTFANYSLTNINGQSIYLRVLVWTANSSSTSYFDNVLVTGTPGYSNVSLTSGSSWTVPSGVTSIYKIMAWGAGGGGGATSASSNGGSGGGGGAMAYLSNLDVTSITTCSYQIGSGGTGATAGSSSTGTSGTDTWFNKSSASAPGTTSFGVLAKGGLGGATNGGTVGAGGVSGSSVGSTVASGGAGGSGGSYAGGGGGASGSFFANGNKRLNTTTIVGGLGNGLSNLDSPGGFGGGLYLSGEGGVGEGSSGDGSAGIIPGGGGGGSNDISTSKGGNGANGMIILVYSSPTIIPSLTSITAFSSCASIASSSSSFTVSSYNLTANLVVTAPAGFQVSTDNSTWSADGGNVSVAFATANASTQTFYVRMSALSSNPTSGNVTCASTNATTKNISVSGTINIPTITGTASVCMGATTVLTGSGSAAAINAWASSNTAVGTINTTTTSGTVTPVAAGTTDITYTDSNGCVSLVTTVTVNALPTTVTVSTAGSYCASTTLTASNGSSGTIYWQNTTSGGTSTTTASTSQVVSSSGTYYFRAQSSASCWGTQGSAAITINAAPTISGQPSSSNQSVCSISTATALTVTAAAGSGSISTYAWYRNSSNSSSGGTSVGTNSNSYTPSETSGTYYYYVVITNSNGCSTTSSVSGAITFTTPNTRYYVANNGWSSISSWSATSGGAGGQSVPTCGDDVVISFTNSGVAYTITGVTNTTLSSLTVNDNVLVTLVGSGAGNATLTLGGNASDDFVTGTSSSLTLEASSGNTRVVKIVMASASTASISGTIIPQYSNGTYFSSIDITNASTFTVNALGRINDGFNTKCFIGNTILNLLINGTFNRTANSGSIPTANWASTSTCIISGTAGTSPTGFGQTFGNMTIDCSGYTVTTDANLSLAGNLTVTAGTFATASTFTLSVTGTTSLTGTLTLAGTGTKTFTGAVTINSGGTITESGIASINFASNLTNNGTYTTTSNTTGVHTFSSSTATIGGTSAVSLAYLTFSGGGTKTISTPVTVTAVLNLNSGGVVTTTSTNIINVTATATGAVTGGSSSNMINGPLKRKMTTGTTYAFPVGSGSTYLPVTLTTVTPVNTPTAEVQAYASGSSGTASGYTISSTEYWSITWGGSTTAAYVALNNGTTNFSTVGTSASSSGTYTTLGGSLSGNVVTATSSVGSVSGILYYSLMNLCTTLSIESQSTTTQTVCQNVSFSSIGVTATGTSPSYQWYSNASASTSSGTSLGTSNGAQTATYTPQSSSTGTTYYYCVVTACGATVTSAISGAMVVNANVTPSVSIASSDADNSFCSGTSVTFTATPTNGGTPSYQWKVGATNVGTNSATYVTTSLVNNDAVTVVMTANNTCQIASTATSSGITNTVNSLPTPTFTSQAGANACSNKDVTYTTESSKTNYTWSVPGTLSTDYSITSGGIGTSSNTVTLKWLTDGNKTVTINYTDGNSCTAASAMSSTATAVNEIATYNGTWDKDISAGTKSITINSSFTANSDISGCSCTVSTGVTVSVGTGNTLTLTNGLTVSGTGTLTFEDDASLLQTNPAATNTGNIVYKRTTSSLRNKDYVYWSSPMASQTLGNIWMGSSAAGTFYSFDPVAKNWATAASGSSMSTGTGYIARAITGTYGSDSTTLFTAPGTWTAIFNGVPNNGLIELDLVENNLYSTNRLIGNPYPSALDLEEFYEDNKTVLGANFYLWTHGSQINNGAYTTSDYATYNAVIGSGVSLVTTNRYVAAGQGFFAKTMTDLADASYKVTFKNTQRVSGNNTNFYRPAQQLQSRNSRPESHKIWLNLTNDKGAFKQQLLAYVQGATNDFDTNLEAFSFGGNPNVDFYSNLTDKKLVIQSRPLPFNADDMVSLGFKSTTAETYQVAIDHVDGLFLDGQTIYLEDKLQNVIHDLKQGAYTFATAAGTFNDRFVVRYTNSSSLENDHFDFNNSVQAITTDKVTVYAGVEPIQSIEVIDLLGRTLRHYEQINATTYTLGNLFKNDKVLFLKIKLSNQVVVTKKIIF